MHILCDQSNNSSSLDLSEFGVSDKSGELFEHIDVLFIPVKHVLKRIRFSEHQFCVRAPADRTYNTDCL